MRNRKGISWILLVAVLVMAMAFSACKKNKNVQEASGDTAEQPAQETPAPTAGPSEKDDEGDRKPADGTALPESVMDIICGASGIAEARDGSLLITDTYNKVVWQVQTHNGVCNIYTGGETVADIYGEPVGGYNDASLSGSYFQSPWAIARFLDGWAVSDAENDAIRLVSKDRVQTVNGSTTEKLTIKNLGVVFDHPTGLAADGEGNLYVSDTGNGAVRKVTADGKVSTVADGLENPMGLCWKDGSLYIVETGANRVIKMTGKKMELVAGSGEIGDIDGAADKAAFAFPQGVAVGNDGTIYVADTGNSAIRVVKDGNVSTLLSRDRTSLELSPVSPIGMLVQGNDLYICDNFSRKVLKIAVK